MALFRKFNYLILCTIAGSCLSIVLLGVAVGTPHWLDANLTFENSSSTATFEIKVNYGLFTGSKSDCVSIQGITCRLRDLKIVCLPSDLICMYSCGQSSEWRKYDIESQFLGGSDANINLICESEPGITVPDLPPSTGQTADKNRFLNYGLWITTLIFLIVGIVLSTLSALQALYNTYRAPVNPIFSVFGLYIWNGISAGCSLLVMILWGSAYQTALKESPAVSDSISETYSTESSKLGYSFWIVILPLLLCCGNIGILRYRTWKIDQIGKKDKVVDHEYTDKNAALF